VNASFTQEAHYLAGFISGRNRVSNNQRPSLILVVLKLGGKKAGTGVILMA